MDFISWPELFLAVGSVAAVFVAVIGLMITIATELAEEGGWFLAGVIVPVAMIVGAAVVLVASVKTLLLAGAVLFLLATPIVLALRRKTDCARALAAGLTLLVVGGAGVALAMSAHFKWFAG